MSRNGEEAEEAQGDSAGEGQRPLFGDKKGSISTNNHFVEKVVVLLGEKTVTRFDHNQLEKSHAAKAAKATLAAAEDIVCVCGRIFLQPSGLATHRCTCARVRQLEYRGMDIDEPDTLFTREQLHQTY